MINVSQAYKQACESNQRESYVIAKYGLYDKNAKGSISNVFSVSKEFSNIDKTYNEIKNTNYNYISCEPNRVKLDDTFYFINDKTKPNSSENLAYWGGEISDENGLLEFLYVGSKEEVVILNPLIASEIDEETIRIDTSVASVNDDDEIIYLTNILDERPVIIYYFNNDILFTELTLYFQEVCEEFMVYYYHNDTLVATRHIYDNNNLTVTTQGATTYSDLYFNRLEIEFVKTKEPYRYVKFNEIDFGVLQQFSDKQIVDYDIIDELSIDSSELSSNSLNLSIDNSNGDYDILNPNNKLSLLQERQEIAIYHYLKVGKKYQELPLGTFLLKEFKVNKQALEIEAYDDIYFMNDIYYGSKFYKNEEVTKILEDLFNYFNYTNYVIDEEIQGITLSGYIPNVEFREALRLIAEASGCVVSKTRYGVTYIYKTYDPISKTFDRRLIDKETPSKNLFNNVIGIVEYNFTNIVENYEIFNATLSVGQHTIIFNDVPIDQDTLVKSDTSNSNYTILGVYATTCIINVTKETNVILKATLIKPTSTLRTIKKDKTSQVSYQEYSIEKVDNTLITSQYEEIGNWKLSRGEIKYNFDTPVVPYIEVGDTCNYKTRFNTTNTFIPTRLEFSKSIVQNIEGE